MSYRDVGALGASAAPFDIIYPPGVDALGSIREAVFIDAVCCDLHLEDGFVWETLIHSTCNICTTICTYTGPVPITYNDRNYTTAQKY